MSNSGKCRWTELSSTVRGMLGGTKRIFLNTENISFKYFSWQLDLTPSQNSWILFCQKNSALASHSLWYSEGLGGYLIPLFPYLVVLLLPQHMHTNMAQPQSADVMMSRRCDCCGLCSHLEDRERGQGGKLAEGWEEGAKKWHRQKIKYKQVQKWKNIRKEKKRQSKNAMIQLFNYLSQ